MGKILKMTWSMLRPCLPHFCSDSILEQAVFWCSTCQTVTKQDIVNASFRYPWSFGDMAEVETGSLCHHGWPGTHNIGHV